MSPKIFRQGKFPELRYNYMNICQQTGTATLSTVNTYPGHFIQYCKLALMKKIIAQQNLLWIHFLDTFTQYSPTSFIRTSIIWTSRPAMHKFIYSW